MSPSRTDPAPPRLTDEPWVVGLLMLLFPPLGLVRLATTPEIGRSVKIGAFALLTIFVLFVIGVETSSHELRDLAKDFLGAAHQRAALGLLREGRLAEAEAHATWASSLAPDQAVVAHTRARIARAREDTAAARYWLEVAALEEGSRADPAAPAPAPASASAPATEATSAPVPRGAADPRWLVELGWLRLDDGDLDGAEALLDAIPAPARRRAGPWPLRSAVLRKRGDLEGARDMARQPVDDFRIEFFGDSYWQLAKAEGRRHHPLRAAYFGLEAIRHGQTRLAYPKARRRVLSWAKRADQDPAPVQAFLTALRLRGGEARPDRVDEEGMAVADRLLEHLDRVRPDFFAGDLLLHTRGSYRFYQLEDYAGAEDLYRQAVTRFPDGETYCRCLFQIFRCREEREDLAGAEQAAYRVMGDCPGSLATAARRRLGRLQAEQATKAKGKAKEAGSAGGSRGQAE